MLFSEITILNGRVVSKDSKAIDSFKEGDRVKIIKNESFNGRTGEFIKEYVNPKKGIIAIVDLGGIEREFPFDNLTKDSYNYNGNDYEKEDLWKLLVKEGKTKRFKELTETQQNGRTDQHALFQSNGGIYAVVRDTKDIGFEKSKRFYVEVDDILDGRKSGSYSNSFDTLSEVRTWVRSVGKKGAKVRIWDNTTNTTSMPTKEMVVDTKDIKLNETPDSEFDAKELALGIKTEMEHTDSREEATSIAKDHLQEPGMSHYYTNLLKMEKELKENENK